MKKLKPIKSDEPKKKKFAGEKLRRKFELEARAEINLQSFLTHQVLYGTQAPFGKNGETSIKVKDLCEKISICVLIDGEPSTVEITEIIVLIDGTVILVDSIGDEWTQDEVSIDDLLNALNVIEKTRLNLAGWQK